MIQQRDDGCMDQEGKSGAGTMTAAQESREEGYELSNKENEKAQGSE